MHLSIKWGAFSNKEYKSGIVSLVLNYKYSVTDIMSCDSGFTTCYYEPGGGYAGGEGNSQRSLQVVKDEWGGEKWVLKGHKNITQPDPQRYALSGTATVNPSGRPISFQYTYGDELPAKIVQATVCAVMCSIIATPLALICMIPMIRKLKKVCLILQQFL